MTSLKRSRSNRATAALPVSVMALAARSRNRVRLGRPVNRSCVAWCHLLSASRRSSSTSWARSMVVLACAAKASKSLRSSSSKGAKPFIAVEGDEGSESPLPAGERHDECAPEFAEEGVGARIAFVVSRRAQPAGSSCWLVIASGDDRRVVDDRSFHRRADFTAQCDVPHRGPFVDDDQLRPVRPHDRLHLFQHRPGRSCGLEVGPTHRPCRSRRAVGGRRNDW